MKKYECEVCAYVYDPELGDPDGGIAPGRFAGRLGLPIMCSRKRAVS